MANLAEGLKRYYSEEHLKKLGSTCVGIVGAGGLGSNVAMMLVRSGIRHFVIADDDVVDNSNLNRQAFFPHDVGSPKVTALKQHLLELEPAAMIIAHTCTVTKLNAWELFAECPIMIEAVDNAATKALLFELFSGQKNFYVSASGMGGIGSCEKKTMTVRKLHQHTVLVGDFKSAVGERVPPLAPRVIQAAALQADAILEYILGEKQ